MRQIVALSLLCAVSASAVSQTGAALPPFRRPDALAAAGEAFSDARSHLAAGLFERPLVGGDTGGKEWERYENL